MKTKLFLMTSAGILAVAGVAFAGGADYSDWGGDTSREYRQLQVVDDSLERIGECRVKNHCHDDGEGEQIQACAILLQIGKGRGDCGTDLCSIERESRFLIGGLETAIRIVCSEGGSGGQVDDASALCADNPAGVFATRGPLKTCAVHGIDQP
jgi:hypothetical protein